MPSSRFQKFIKAPMPISSRVHSFADQTPSLLRVHRLRLSDRDRQRQKEKGERERERERAKPRPRHKWPLPSALA
ncbi:hypothetical protein ACE6H2_014680 [Prunus campanulata]